MANPEVMKRLEEIEAKLASPGSSPTNFYFCEAAEACGMPGLLRLTRALLESQGELLEPAKHGASALAGRIGDCTCSVSLCKSCRGTEKALDRWDKAIARAERIRKGEV